MGGRRTLRPLVRQRRRHGDPCSFQTFDFEGMSDYPEVLEPLVFYMLHRANALLAEPTTAARFKVFVLDEAWRFFRHPAIKAYVTAALKTWRKKNAAMILATQSVDDLRQSELLPVVVESCPTSFSWPTPAWTARSTGTSFI